MIIAILLLAVLLPAPTPASRRSRRPVWAVALTLFTLCAPARASEPHLRRGARPAWVSPAAVDLATAVPAGVQNGRRYHLMDHQVRIDGGKFESYSRWVIEVTNESGLQASAQLNLGFDPSSETLTVHSVVIHRDGKILDRLDFDAIKLAEREPDLERQVFDGRKSAVLFVADLRVNDVIDYDYTLRGADPTLGGRYEGAFALGAPEPIEHLRGRLIAPRTSPIHVILHGFDPASMVAAHEEDVGATREYSWDLHDVPAFTAETDVPSWVEPAPWAEISQFESWQDVARWGAVLFSHRETDPAVLRWVEEDKREGERRATDDFILRALRFVQDQIRYVGVEVGIARRRPAAPGVVLARRYGDCKDKVSLFVALLAAGGVEARPALVSTSHGATMLEWGPSAAAFDHAIVRVSGSDGTVYWLDPTRTLEGGTLERYRHSSYERALTLSADTSDLESLRGEGIPPASPSVVDHFHVGAPGSSEETTLDSERTYEGAFADMMRGVFRAQTLEQATKSYRQLYERDYPGLREIAPLERSDDREKNLVRVSLHFALPKFWTWDEKTKSHQAESVARTLEPRFERPATEGRKLPLAVPYPFHQKYRADFDLPFDLPLVPDNTNARASVLDFSFASAGADRKLSYSYDLAMRGREVAVESLPAYVAALDKGRPTLFRSLLYRGPGPTGVNGIAVSLAALCAVLSLIGAIAIHRHEVKGRAPLPEIDAPPRIGGWLGLLGLNVVLAPFVYFVALVGHTSLNVLTAHFWYALATPELPGYHPAVAFVAVGEVLCREALCGYLAVVALLFVQKRGGFPLHFIVCTATVVSYLGLDAAVCTALHLTEKQQIEAWASFARALLWALVWCAYVARSRRVRETFVVGAPPSPKPSPSAEAPLGHP